MNDQSTTQKNESSETGNKINAIMHKRLLRHGLFIVILLIIAVAIMLIVTGGHLNRAFEIVLYICVALVTGILFWLFTPGSTGDLDFKKLGIKLGGGAAIGASFMLLAWYLTEPNLNYVVIPKPSYIPQEFTIINQSSQEINDVGEVRTKGGKQYLYIEFRDGKDEGIIDLNYLKNGNITFAKSQFKATIKGELVNR